MDINLFKEWTKRLHVFGLMLAHQRADSALRMELSRKFHDSARVQQLKKLKLRIKDRLHLAARAQARLAPA